MSWVYEREARKLLDFERSVIEDFDAGFFVSKHEAELFRELAPEFSGKIGHVNNGVDLAYFSPHLDFVNPYSEQERALVFVGAMDYWPNIDAVSWFAEHVFPLVRARVPAAHFYIVGGNPAPQVRALGGHPGITVTGRVDDVRPYVSHANVAVAPLRIARGVQNKVLESMAMARPTVVTPAALEGIEAEPGSELLLADDAAGFAAKTCEVLEGVIDGRVLGDAARRRVELAYGWQSNLVSFGRLLEGEATPAGLMDRTAYG
jgi:sugar transferase (PEP-CTERM/EpsH1 system associated)